MSTVSLNENPVQARESTFLPISKPDSWTDVKVKRTWAASIAAIAFIGSAVCTAFAFTATLWLLAAAIPLVLATGALVWYAVSSVDYDSPQELAKVREKALKMTLPQIIEKHGFDKLFRYSILSPKQFETACSAHMQRLDLNSLIAYYEEASRNLDILELPKRNCFSIPQPKLWKGKLAQETNGLDFRSIQDGYSLPALMHYELIQPKELEDSFIAYANSKSLSEIVARYEKALPILKGDFSLPSPEMWKTKFREETSHLNCSEILSYHPGPDVLLKYKIISKEEREIISEGQKAIDLFTRQKEECRAEFEKRTERERQICEKTKDLARQSYESTPNEAYGNALFTQYIRDLNALEQAASAKIDAEKARLSAQAPVRQPASVEERKQFADLNSRCERACTNIRHRLDFDKAFLLANYDRNKNLYQRNREAARQIRDQACSLADEQYALATKPVRDEIDAKLARFAEEKTKKLAEINARYAAFRIADLQPASQELQAQAV